MSRWAVAVAVVALMANGLLIYGIGMATGQRAVAVGGLTCAAMPTLAVLGPWVWRRRWR